MKMFKFIASWQFWVSIIMAALIFVGLMEGTFWGLNAYTSHGEQVEVPNLNNLTLDQAVVKLDESNLEYEIDTSKYDPKFKSYQILDIYPLMGSNVKKGRRIFIRANAKTWKPVAVPNILGKYKYLAFSQLDLVGLKVSDTIYEPNLAVNTVLKILYKGKEVQPGVTLPRFSSLSIVLAKGLAKNVSVPSFIGLDEVAADKMITENLFSVGSVIYDNPEDKSNARVYYQVPAPASTYDQGQAIDIYLSAKPLDELRDKIKNLDATFNLNQRGVSYRDDSLYVEEQIESSIPRSTTESGSTTTHSQPSTNTESSKPKKEDNSHKPSGTKENEHKRPNRVVLE